MYKFAFFDCKPYDKPAFEKFGKQFCIKYKFFDTKLSEDTASLANGYDGVVVFVNDDVNVKVIKTLEKGGVKLIALRCAGFNNVDVEAAYGKLHIVRVPAYSPYAVAEHAMALLLTLVRRTHKAYARTKDFNFSLSGLTGFDLHDKTVGVVGAGKIGRVFIDICRGFGLKVIAFDTHAVSGGDIEFVAMSELFERSDIISLHCPLTAETLHMINKPAITKMKKGVIIINTSRGALISAEDLIWGIREHRVGGACLDVYEEESDLFFEDFSDHIIRDDTLVRLIALPNVLITSHQAFLTEEALSNIAETTSQNIVDFFTDKPLPNEVCYNCGKKEDCKTNGRKGRCF